MNTNRKESERLLDVGDVLYMTERYSDALRKIVIDRVTPTQAIAGNIKFNRETINVGTRAKQIGSYSSCELENFSLKDRYFRQQAALKIKNFDYSKLSTSALRDILKILNENR